MTLNDLFDSLSEKLSEDASIKNSELFGNEEVIRFKRFTTTIRKAGNESANLIIERYSAFLNLDLGDDSIACDFRHLGDAVDMTYLITINGEEAYLRNINVFLPPIAYSIPDLSAWIINKLLETAKQRIE